MLETPDRTISSEAIKMKNIIYRITNIKNNKVYIGQTTQGLQQRKREHVCRFNRGEREHKLYQAFKKYGLDSFVFEELVCALSQEYLTELEIMFIYDYNSFNRGYNSTVGDFTVSDATKEKIRNKLKGRTITWYDKILESRKRNGSICGGHTKSTFKIKTPLGNIDEGTNISAYCRDHSISIGNLYQTQTGRNCCKGYILLERSTTRA